MSHRRIRKFNTRDTYPNQKLDNDFCQAVVAGNTVVSHLLPDSKPEQVIRAPSHAV